jgi:hypothetical protein
MKTIELTNDEILTLIYAMEVLSYEMGHNPKETPLMEKLKAAHEY